VRSRTQFGRCIPGLRRGRSLIRRRRRRCRSRLRRCSTGAPGAGLCSSNSSPHRCLSSKHRVIAIVDCINCAVSRHTRRPRVIVRGRHALFALRLVGSAVAVVLHERRVIDIVRTRCLNDGVSRGPAVPCPRRRSRDALGLRRLGLMGERQLSWRIDMVRGLGLRWTSWSTWARGTPEFPSAVVTARGGRQCPKTAPLQHRLPGCPKTGRRAGARRSEARSVCEFGMDAGRCGA
jgi:hypothetical protein